MNVLLGGGGLKGAYQYGFFKKVYEIEPNFKINKLYAVSVGSLNAIPILTKKMNILEKHWSHPDLLPFDTIVNDWPSVQGKTEHSKNIQRLRAFLKHGSVFHSLNTNTFISTLKGLSEEDKQIIKNKLIVICYDTIKQKTVFSRCRNIKETVESIRRSSMFPGLFSLDSDIIDGYNINLSNIIEKERQIPWICLDLQGHIKNEVHKTYVYSPKITDSTAMNLIACIFTTRDMLDDFINEGENDAIRFLNRI